jgi:hypothetical protein
MSLTAVKDRAVSLLADVGRAAMHANYPNDFEFYSIAFELIDYKDKTTDIFVFPILPSSLSISEQPNTNVKRTGGGTAVLFNSSFQPFNVTMNGNFGRKFRFLVGQSDVLGVAFRFSFRSKEFDTQIKTGYGATKVLERLLKDSLKTDEQQRPFKLIFHNMAFNQSHVVEVMNFGFSQNDSNSNMIWQYSISLRAIAPALFIRNESANKSSLRQLLSSSVLQNTLNVLLSSGLETFHKSKTRLLNG